MSDKKRDMPDDAKMPGSSPSGNSDSAGSKDSQHDAFAKNLDKLNKAMVSGALANKLTRRLQDHSHELRDSVKRFGSDKDESGKDSQAGSGTSQKGSGKGAGSAKSGGAKSSSAKSGGAKSGSAKPGGTKPKSGNLGGSKPKSGGPAGAQNAQKKSAGPQESSSDSDSGQEKKGFFSSFKFPSFGSKGSEDAADDADSAKSGAKAGANGKGKSSANGNGKAGAKANGNGKSGNGKASGKSSASSNGKSSTNGKGKSSASGKSGSKAGAKSGANSSGAPGKSQKQRPADAHDSAKSDAHANESAKERESDATKEFLASLDQKFPGVSGPKTKKQVPPPPTQDHPAKEEVHWQPIHPSSAKPRPLGETDNLKAVDDGQPKKLKFTRLGAPITKLPGGTKVLKNSMREVRSTVDALNAGERIDPTRPTIALFAALAVVAFLVSLTTLVGTSALPSAKLPFSDQPVVTEETEETTEASAPEEPTEKPAPAPAKKGPAPAIKSIDVISYNNDGGDHQEWADRMIDGDVGTRWQSRYFAQPDLPEDQTIRLVVHLKENSSVSKVILKGPIDGGQVDLRINDGTQPFGTPVVTSSQMSATTTLAPSEPQMGNTVTLNFVSLPTEDEGRYRLKIDELRVE